MIRPPLRSTLFPYTTLFRSGGRPPKVGKWVHAVVTYDGSLSASGVRMYTYVDDRRLEIFPGITQDTLTGIISRSEEHTSELQSQSNLVCRLLLEKKKKKKRQ